MAVIAGTDRGQDKRERLDEIAEILSLGLMRLQARKSSGKSPYFGESSLDFSACESGHPTPRGEESLG